MKKIFTFFLALTASVGMSWATTKSIIINESSYGSVVASSSSAAAGETITLTATPDDGYQLKSISGVYVPVSETLNATSETVNGKKFQAQATSRNNNGWRVYNPGTANTLTVSSLNGTTLITKIEFTSTWGGQRKNNMLSVSAGTLSFDPTIDPDTIVTINGINATSVTISGSGTNAGGTWCISSVKVYTDEEYTDEVLEISDTENANVKTFTMVESEVTISAEFEPAPADNSVKLYHNFYGDWTETEAFGIYDDYISEYAKISMILEPGDYQFALKVGGELRGDGTALSRAKQACILEEGLTANLTLNVDVKGTYRFYWFYDEKRFAMDVPNVCSMYWKNVTDDKFEVTLGKESEVTLPKLYTNNMSFATNIFNGVDQVRLVSTDETVATIEYTIAMDGLGTITIHKAGECDIYAVHDITYYYCYDSVAFHLTVNPEPEPEGDGKLTGAFTINAGGDKIMFSKGNLQFTRTSTDVDWSTGTFKLADHQYDMIEEKANPYCTDNYGDKTAVGLFGWGTWGEGKTPNATSHDATTYTWSTDFKGTLEGIDTWRTLSKDEWAYLLANHNLTFGTVHGVHGLLIAPDGKDFDAKSMANYDDVTVSDDDWTDMEAAGIVFLPACGQRAKTAQESANIITAGQGEEVLYYSSTPHESQAKKAYNILYSPDNVASDDFSSKNQAFGVRLVTAYVAPTPTAIDQITNDQSQMTNKVLRDGQLLIIRDGKTYTVTGTTVK